ncbi:uncharacterized protein LOC135107303 [Scylla paramamosain]|uniref:uncharacterized protein LOC135107303 n=1 Tax=Scylla paramamosain TaxID=85552 RepID=UPI0030831535
MRPPLTTAVASSDPKPGNINALALPASGFFITDILSGHIKLIAANGSTIPTYSTRTIPIQAAERSFSWDFVITDVKTPLLGVDFLSHYGLLIDVANHKLLDVATFRSAPLGSHCRHTEICSLRIDIPYDMLRQKFPEVFCLELHQQHGHSSKHGIFHYIKTTDPPVHSKFRQLSPEKLQAEKQA